MNLYEHNTRDMHVIICHIAAQVAQHEIDYKVPVGPICLWLLCWYETECLEKMQSHGGLHTGNKLHEHHIRWEQQK